MQFCAPDPFIVEKQNKFSIFDIQHSSELNMICSLFQGRKFANQQMDMYDWAGDLLSNTLGMDGKACVQRLICELAEVPVNDRSFMGEILHRIVE